MKLIIRDENGNKKYLLGNNDEPFIATVIIITLIILTMIWFYFYAGLGGLGFLIVFVIIGILLFLSEEKITIDIGLKSVIIEHRTTVINRFKWKEIERIDFSKTKEVRIIHQVGGEEEYRDSWELNLIATDGNSKKILEEHSPERPKIMGILISKAIGVDAQYIDEKKNSTLLIGSST